MNNGRLAGNEVTRSPALLSCVIVWRSMCQANVATACATRSPVPTAGCVSPTAQMASSACARLASEASSARRVSHAKHTALTQTHT